jgi:hypothetical protein
MDKVVKKAMLFSILSLVIIFIASTAFVSEHSADDLMIFKFKNKVTTYHPCANNV